ncbi:thiolase family protein [Desulfosarcina ovata]|uniref:Acetyl-CoA acetyltransferase n=1 Tax=Desulfosarcina ovata subsp. ovata TaxID=2752305 RepID=A0A5K8A6K4_9BACT|nr:thiolase family protein [Desulfosarcina ovata]BBO88099.1 acetyl-CoA acetyltransferase [Desulfosarcina ovata subsp. ovata]
MKDEEIVIVSAARSPFGRYCGSLKDMDYFDLGAIPMKEVLNRLNLESNVVDEVFWGVGDTSVCKDVFTPVAARQTLLKAGLPSETPSISIDKACVSAMSAAKLASMAIKLGEIDVAIAGGATSFSQEPLIVRGLRYKGFRIGNVEMEDPLFQLGYKDFNPVSVDTDDVANEYKITREEMDEWALRSHQNYGEAWKAGKFKDEIIPIEIPKKGGGFGMLDIDEQYRADSSLERLSRLKPVYGTRAITAGNAPGLNDGATALLLMAKRKAKDLGLDVLGEIVAMTSIAIHPNRMPEGPGFAIKKVLKMADLFIDDVRVMEINEAFAAVPIVSIEVACDNDREKAKRIQKKTNINGSAIAIGHPNTASGARIMMNLMYELKRQGGGYAIGAICGGLAQADACIIKV